MFYGSDMEHDNGICPNCSGDERCKLAGFKRRKGK